MPRTRSAPPAQAWKRLLPALGLIAGLGLFLLVLVQVGKFTRARIGTSERYALDFASIECTPPPGTKQADFLSEVQRAGELPAALHLLERDLPARLADAFSRHPYVATVDQVIPSEHGVRVQLTYRTPVLEVMVSERVSGNFDSKKNQSEDPSWFVDARAIVLPRKNLDETLPLMLRTKPPSGQPGEAWGDVDVAAAARTAAFLAPHQRKLQLMVFETNDGELVLSTAGGTKVLWGHAPGEERPAEARGLAKVDNLLNFCKSHGSLEGMPDHRQHDVRAARNER